MASYIGAFPETLWIPVTNPSPPQSLTATAGAGQVVLSWAAPASDGGSAVTGYHVDYGPSPTGPWTRSANNLNALTHTVTGLTPGVVTHFVVYAVNASPVTSSPATASATPFTVPGQVPAITLIDVTTTDFTVEWLAPTSNGGSPITDYTIEIRLIGAPTYTVYADGIDPVPTAVVGELEPATEYEFRIAASNAAGTGPFSLPVSVTTDADIPAPIPGDGVKARLAQIAGVPGAEAVEAANAWAGTTGETFVSALNIKAGTVGESAKTALNVLAGTTGEEAVVAARKIGGYE